MTTDLEKQLRDIVYAALDAHDVEKYVSFHADDVVVYLPDGSVMHGKQEMRDYFLNLYAAFPDTKFEMVSCISSESLECDEWIMSGTQLGDYMGIPPTGKSISIRGVSIRKMKDGKANPVAFYFDSASILRQLGARP